MKRRNALTLVTIFMLFTLLVQSCSGYNNPSSQVITIDEDGIFTMSPTGSYPIFDYCGKYDRTYIGYYSSDHTIKLRYWEHISGRLSNAVTLWQEWGYCAGRGTVLGDDHANPAVIVLKYQRGANALHNGKLLVATAEHGSVVEGRGRLQVRRSSRSEDISSWEDPNELSSTNATYARLIETFDGKIWLFCRLFSTAANSRATFYYWISETAGDVWVGPELLIDTDDGVTDAIYMAVAENMASDGLHFMFNRMVYHKPVKNVHRYQDIYYVYYDVASSTWHRCDGTLLTLPLTLSSVDIVYKTDNTPGSEDWTYLSNITADENGEPYLLSCNDQDKGTSSPGGIGEVLRHHYDKKECRWITEKVCSTARFQYLNLAALGPNNVDVIYACVPNHSGVGELQKWKRKEGQWVKVLDITKGSLGHNARPYVTQCGSGGTRILWSYITQYKGSPYNDWESKILGFNDLLELGD